MTRRALTFGSVAAAYEQFRPAYPDEIVAAILAYAQRPVRSALEIGAGTGKATRAFAGHGIAVTATEPDAAMLGELRMHVPSSVTTVQAAFEDLAADQAYDLVYVAAALHWTQPDGRWSRVAALLAPHGVFASFGGPTRLCDPAVEDAVRIARSPWLAGDDISAPDGTLADSAMKWPGTELERSELFTDVRQSTFRRRTTLSAGDYVGLLSTVSAYLELPATDRRQALDRILEVLPATVDVSADVDLHLARLA